MKKLLGILSVFCSLSAFATDWVFDYTKSTGDVNWTASIGTSETPGYWFDKANPSTYITGSFSASDSFAIGENSNRKINLNLSSDLEIFNLNISTFNNNATSINAGGKNLTINGNLISYSQTFINNLNTLYIKGDFNSTGNGIQTKGKKLIVEGDITGTHPFYNTFSSNITSFEDGLANPNVLIKGTIKDSATYYVSTVNNGGDSYAKIGGIQNSGKIAHAAANGQNYVGYAILTNTTDYTTSGSITELSYPYVYTPTSGRLCLVMNGSATQEFTSTNLLFFGGAKVMGGTLKMNFNQNVSNYYYNSQRTDNANYTRVTAAIKNSDETYKVSTFSHGDLQMLGGTFASSDSTSSYGVFRFANIEYTAGTIKLRLDSSTKMDTITLESYYNKSDKYVNGAITDTSYALVEGGTLSKAEGADKVTFDFGSNLEWLIDAENDGVKIISWDAAKKSSLLSDDFAANTFTNTDGDQFKALFAVNDDGLYVKYVAVPEPATIAAIFGAMALAFAAYRRRK